MVLRIATSAFCVAIAWVPLNAQVLLPKVSVEEKAGKTTEYGGYVISGDFQVDPKLSAVIFPSEALNEGDVLSVAPLRMADDEYLVLQECASADCLDARLVRVWGAPVGPSRYVVPHTGKFFLWMKKIESGAAPAGTGQWFTNFKTAGPPLTLEPVGPLAAYSKKQIAEAENDYPIRVVASKIENATFIATFEGGTVVRVKRMHAANEQ